MPRSKIVKIYSKMRGKNFTRHITRQLFLFLTILCMAACSTKISIEPNNIDVNHQSVTLEKGKSAFIALPRAAVYDGRVYENSGLQVADYTRDALIGKASPVILGNKPDNNVNELLRLAEEQNAFYLFVPAIRHWEPRAAAWSGMPTQVSIQLQVYDVATKNMLIDVTTSVIGKRMTFVSQNAHDLARLIIKQLIDSLYN